MKKGVKIIVLIILGTTLIFGGYKLYSYLRVKYAKVEVELVPDLILEFNEQKKVSDYINKINGKILNDYIIDSTKLGEKEVKFKFINDDNIKLKYSFKLEVVDTKEPLIWIKDTHKINRGSNDFKEKVLCGDNYDSNPTCWIEGEYDLNQVGDYSLVYKAIDSSGNEINKKFVLKVIEPEKKEDTKTSINFEEIVKKYKNENTKIGIDVSKWQGDIDFEKIKNAGVEFIMIKVGGSDKEANLYLDKKFKQNIENANRYNIDAGVYFFSNASSINEASKEAKWVVKQIKKYDISLPVVYDWEDWTNFNSYNLSFFGLNNMATEFLDKIEKNGYRGACGSRRGYAH